MEFKEQFERPLPIINKDVDKIYLETSNNCEGSLTIKNDSGGEIMGRIMSNSRFLTFEPAYFEGNNSNISFYVNLDIYNPGDIFRTNAVIMSNGGEHTIEFTVKIIPYAINTKEGISISNLNQFYNYAKKHPISARGLFTNHEFMMWLHASGYEYMDLYEKFAMDSNKERALDNFLLLNKLKYKADIEFETDEIQVSVPCFNNDMVHGIISIRKTGWGYIHGELKNNKTWLYLGKNTINSSDFDDENKTYINYSVDPLNFRSKVNYDKIICNGKELMIKAVKMDFIKAGIERNFLSYKDMSYILLENNTEDKLQVNIYTRDNFVKFESIKYFIDKKSSIPFRIDMPVIISAQHALKKQSSMASEICVESTYKGKTFRKIFRITIGKLD